jgi:hypothetical protein
MDSTNALRDMVLSQGRDILKLQDVTIPGLKKELNTLRKEKGDLNRELDDANRVIGANQARHEQDMKKIWDVVRDLTGQVQTLMGERAVAKAEARQEEDAREQVERQAGPPPSRSTYSQHKSSKFCYCCGKKNHIVTECRKHKATWRAPSHKCMIPYEAVVHKRHHDGGEGSGQGSPSKVQRQE